MGQSIKFIFDDPVFGRHTGSSILGPTTVRVSTGIAPEFLNGNDINLTNVRITPGSSSSSSQLLISSSSASSSGSSSSFSSSVSSSSSESSSSYSSNSSSYLMRFFQSPEENPTNLSLDFESEPSSSSYSSFTSSSGSSSSNSSSESSSVSSSNSSSESSSSYSSSSYLMRFFQSPEENLTNLSLDFESGSSSSYSSSVSSSFSSSSYSISSSMSSSNVFSSSISSSYSSTSASSSYSSSSSSDPYPETFNTEISGLYYDTSGGWCTNCSGNVNGTFTLTRDPNYPHQWTYHSTGTQMTYRLIIDVNGKGVIDLTHDYDLLCQAGVAFEASSNYYIGTYDKTTSQCFSTGGSASVSFN